MNKVIGIVLAVAFLFGGAYIWINGDRKMAQDQIGSDSGTETVSEPIYFYGEECPHCHDVMKFLEENKIAEKVKFEKKEVWHDKKNAAEMNDKARSCGLDVKKIGVPFLFAEGKCHIGTPDVEAYFSKAAGLSEAESQ